MHKEWWQPVVHFFGQLASGSLIFILIALAAFGLSEFVHLLEHFGADSFTVDVLTLLERFILIADSLPYAVYLLTTFVKAIKEHWQRSRSGNESGRNLRAPQRTGPGYILPP